MRLRRKDWDDDMRMVQRHVENITVLDLAGQLTIDEGAEQLGETIKSLIQQGRTAVIVNLGDVPYIDSGGLGQLVACYSSLVKAGGALKLLNVGNRNHDLLSITRLVTVFQTFDSEQDAIGSFASSPAASSLTAKN